jgi:isopentenyl phosphate kinase
MSEPGKTVIFLKLGGSLITEKSAPQTINYQTITRIVKELKEAIDSDPRLQLVVGHGGGSFPHPVAQAYRTAEGFVHETSVRGFALCQHAASTLNRLIVDLMVDYAINAVSIQPSACAIATNGTISGFFSKPVEAALDHGLVPVLFGDCVFDTVKGCCILSTEQLFSFLSGVLRPSRVLIAGLVRGVYTADPQKDKNARFIPSIDVEQLSTLESCLGGSFSVDVTGGMASKVRELIELAKRGIESEILSGAPGNIRRALAGQRGLGTVILPVKTAGP